MENRPHSPMDSNRTTEYEPAFVRTLHAAGRKQGTPVSATFELTAGCNFNCGMCYIHEAGAHSSPREELTAAQWLEIGRQAFEAGTVFLLLTGGEPLLRPDFAQIYTGLKDMGFMISVNTNGVLLCGELAQLFEDNPPMRLNVSLYADSGEGYIRQCGVDAFDRVIANIQHLKEAGVQIQLNTSFTPENQSRYKQMYALSCALGLHCRSTAYLYPPVRRQNAGAESSRLSPEDAGTLRVRYALLRGKERMLELSDAQLAEMLAPACDDLDLPGEGVRCRAGHTSYWVDAAGRMLMCGMIPVPCGNVLDEGFAACCKQTHAFMQSVQMPAKCAACKLRPLCCVCPAACYAETGCFDVAPPYLCRMSARIARELSQLKKGDGRQ